MSEKIASPAVLGRYGLIALFQSEGRMFRSGGITNMIAAKVAMPPAVFRTIAPRPSANTPISVR